MLSLLLMSLVTAESSAATNTPSPRPASDEPPLVELFDGHSLAGWTYLGTPGGVRVEDDAIRLQSVGPGEQAGHLFFVGDDPSQPRLFRDFELVIESRGEGESNSGLFFHTSPRQRTRFGLLADGYEVQLNNVPKEKNKTGSLYAVERVDVSPVDENEWFTMWVRVQGDVIEVFITETDGTERSVVRYVEPVDVIEQRPKNRKGRHLFEQGGQIALQAHDTGSVWHFRRIAIRELPKSEGTTRATPPSLDDDALNDDAPNDGSPSQAATDEATTDEATTGEAATGEAATANGERSGQTPEASP